MGRAACGCLGCCGDERAAAQERTRPWGFGLTTRGGGWMVKQPACHSPNPPTDSRRCHPFLIFSFCASFNTPLTCTSKPKRKRNRRGQQKCAICAFLLWFFFSCPLFPFLQLLPVAKTRIGFFGSSSIRRESSPRSTRVADHSACVKCTEFFFCVPSFPSRSSTPNPCPPR